eukprot:13262942-Heterocapsa_arctica.AAC.1
MPELTGWTIGQDGSSVHPAPADLNARQDNFRFRHDCSTQWKESGATIWDGFPQPCGCDHASGANQKE